MPVIMTASVPNVLLVRADSTIKSVDDLIAKAREKQDGVTYGSAGVGSSHHLAGALFTDTIGSQMLHIPYKGSAPALQALVAGDIDILFDNLTSAVPLVESGRLRALAITSSTPSEALPNIKPLKDLGLKDYEVVSWQAVYVPAGTPQAIVDKLYTVLHAAMQKPAAQDRLKGMGMTISGAGPEELATFQKAKIAKWAALIRKANIKVNN
ncbi:Bug family tripartite tricarboxylate transporter substrate binding protein [Alcaligenes sp. SDU_A2]|uniref:Bug family tripartite tricarboxylate transporter substrate binding protein n=1 Tax=Alcaligenes sp. SDU_A2 TaxID=3136634 RepID=UPI00311FF054